MIVEDDADLLEALTAAFALAGIDVCGECAFVAAHRRLRDRPVDALLTDIRLGDHNGLQLAYLARDINPGTRLVVFSGFDDPVLRRDAESLGAAFLLKPVSAATLIDLATQTRG